MVRWWPGRSREGTDAHCVRTGSKQYLVTGLAWGARRGRKGLISWAFWLGPWETGTELGLVWGMWSLRCLRNTQVEVSRRQLNVCIWTSKGRSV